MKGACWCRVTSIVFLFYRTQAVFDSRQSQNVTNLEFWSSVHQATKPHIYTTLGAFPRMITCIKSSKKLSVTNIKIWPQLSLLKFFDMNSLERLRRSSSPKPETTQSVTVYDITDWMDKTEVNKIRSICLDWECEQSTHGL